MKIGDLVRRSGIWFESRRLELVKETEMETEDGKVKSETRHLTLIPPTADETLETLTTPTSPLSEVDFLQIEHDESREGQDARSSSPLPSRTRSASVSSSTSSFSSSSSSDTSYPSTVIMENGDRKNATVVSNGLKHPPIVTAGTVTPEVLQSFQLCCMHYFNYKKVAETDCVTTIAPSFQSPHVQQWYFANVNTLKANTFDDKLLRSYQSVDDSFDNWVESLETTNALLFNTTATFSDARLREHIESHATEDLRNLAESAAAIEIKGFQEFKALLSEADSKRRRVRAQRKLEIESILGSRTRSLGTSSAHRFTAAAGTPLNGGSSAGTNTNARHILPKLTEAEQKLLLENKGCLKCRKVNAGHFVKDCPIGFPNPTTYRNPVTGSNFIAATLDMPGDFMLG
ncbi:hypothetical protein PHLCEN_2v6813 [Hermanssonia centrifuga]|uniref:Uncharacterized protein n=1 Tax=Hermanssonia centrifuga TaxID=98765 RepID=A0A2R6NYB6_9APHY|nr:hypothetical protein PHLCEN_2v6813 [Hermanssonia centrifuga]